jgi:hypothetical protein
VGSPRRLAATRRMQFTRRRMAAAWRAFVAALRQEALVRAASRSGKTFPALAALRGGGQRG